MKHVPTLDLRRYDTDREAFVREVGQAYEEFGFCCFTGHGVDPALVQQAYEVCREFFQSDRAVKMKTFVQGKAGTRGYTPLKIETAKTSKLADLKEFYHVGRDVSVGPFGDPQHSMERAVGAQVVPLFTARCRSSVRETAADRAQHHAGA